MTRRTNHPSSRRVKAISSRVAAWDAMVLQLITLTPETQMFFGAAQMILRAAPDPVIIRMCSRPVAHYPGHYFQRFSERFHPSHSSYSIQNESDLTITFYAWYSETFSIPQSRPKH
jgi:hypothetical protein